MLRLLPASTVTRYERLALVAAQLRSIHATMTGTLRLLLRVLRDAPSPPVMRCGVCIGSAATSPDRQRDREREREYDRE